MDTLLQPTLLSKFRYLCHMVRQDYALCPVTSFMSVTFVRVASTIRSFFPPFYC